MLGDAVREAEAGLGPERLVGEVRAARAGLGAGADRDADVGAERVGLRGEHARGRRPTCRARRSRPRRAAAGAIAAPSAARPGSTTRNRRRSRSRRVCAAQRLALAHRRDRAGRRACRHVTSAVIVAGPHTPSGSRPCSRWKLAQRGLGLGAEDAVFAAGVEAERVQPALQLDHVVAAQHRRARCRAGDRRARSRSRSARPTSRGPQMPSTRRPRAASGTRARPSSVSSPKLPSSVTA